MDFSRYTIVTDLDSTLLYKGVLPPQNAQAIETFTKSGGRFTIATGRNHLSVQNAVPDVVRLLNAPAILCNGTYFYDFEKGERMGEVRLTPEQAKGLLCFAKTYFPNVPFRISVFDGFRCEGAVGYLKDDIKTYGESAVDISPADTWPLDDWYKLVFRHDPEVLEPVRALFEEKMANSGIAIFKTARHFLETQSERCNKAKGIEWLRDRLPNRGGTVIACGDFENDIDMLKAADVAICPENAVDAVKCVSHHVLCHCSEGLFVEVLKRIEEGKI